MAAVTPQLPIPPEFKKARWEELEAGQAIWYVQSNPRPQGPWIVVDPSARLIRPLNGTVHRRLDLDEVLIRPGSPPPKPG
ncbi:MAG: hypothetical protein HY303_06365 [Candidatus Wallbacteria bacterium]|nr:hypothetical protein [Candidatus Wallbacteria bacterium]